MKTKNNADIKINLEKIQKQKPIKELLNFSIINIDKPTGPTSFDIDLEVKKALNLNKTSHFGTLDPIVTGVLPVALGRACRLMNYFIGHKKEYIGIMHLHKDISETELKKEMNKFIGKINQLPPVKSRVKRQIRQRQVYNFEVLEFDKNNKDALFKSEVEAGTYIRKLISDLGEAIGGAHMTELRRTRASVFEEKDSINLYKFLEAVNQYKKGNETKLREILIPGEIISKILPVIEINDKNYIEKLFHGAPLFKEKVEDAKNKDFILNDKIAIFNKNEFIGIFNIISEGQILAKPEFVMQPIAKN